jgi:DNA-binding MarR family transcriptional regulator
MTVSTPYTPNDEARAILLALDEHGAQLSPDLARLAGVQQYMLNSYLSAAIRRSLIGRDPRVHNGKRCALWYLTPAGSKVAEALATEGAAE